MPRHCSATGCKSRDNKDARLAGVTFHRLPKKGNPRRTTWIVNARRKGPGEKGLWEPQSDYIYFCSKHFTPDSFELSGVSGYRRLKDDAVPMLVEILPGQKGKSSRGRGKTRNEDRQLSTRSRADKESSDSKETQIKVALVHIVQDEVAESIKISKEEHQNETSPLLSLPLQEPAPDQPTEIPSTPPSPSRYMRRLPPPPGFYLAKEHSYAQLCPLEWRKRYEKATDNLEKALRLLRAARRRENRLRLTLLRLQESRLKQTLSQMQDRRKESHESQSRSSQIRQSGKPARSGQDRGLEAMEENEMERTGEELLTDENWRKEGAEKLRDGVEDEEGCCFYCGRGREEEETKEARNQLGARRSLVFQGRRGRGRGRNTSDVFREMTQNTAESKVETKLPNNPEQLTLLHSKPEMLLQMHALPGPTQSTSTYQEVTSSPQLQNLHLLQPDLGILHPDTAASDLSVTQSEDGGGEMGHVFLVHVSSETKEKSGIVVGVEGSIQKKQAIVMAEETFQHDIIEQGDVPSDNIGLSPSGLRGNQCDQQTNIRLVGGDVAQRLKEHLEGFQLQLSSEFSD